MNSNHWLTSELIHLTQKTEPEAPAPAGRDEAATRQLLHDFLEILDSLDRLIVMSQENNLSAPGWFKQLDTLRAQILQVFERAGVSFADSLGQGFDPARHEAVGAVERDDSTNHAIVEVLARGCTWQGKLLRAARVIVACHSKPEPLDLQENKL